MRRRNYSRDDDMAYMLHVIQHPRMLDFLRQDHHHNDDPKLLSCEAHYSRFKERVALEELKYYNSIRNLALIYDEEDYFEELLKIYAHNIIGPKFEGNLVYKYCKMAPLQDIAIKFEISYVPRDDKYSYNMIDCKFKTEMARSPYSDIDEENYELKVSDYKLYIKELNRFHRLMNKDFSKQDKYIFEIINLCQKMSSYDTCYFTCRTQVYGGLVEIDIHNID